MSTAHPALDAQLPQRLAIDARQAPVASLGRRRMVWDNGSIEESFNGVTTPLTFSVALRAHARGCEQTMRVVGVSDETIDACRPAMQRLLGFVSGRVYRNVDNWHRCLLPLSPFGRRRKEMERLLGVRPSRLQKLRELPRRLWVGWRLALGLRRLDGAVERFIHRFDSDLCALEERLPADAGLDELLRFAESIQSDFAKGAAAPIMSEIRVAVATARVRRLLTRSLGERQARDLAATMLSAEESTASAERTRRLMELAHRIRRDPDLRHALSTGDPAGALERLRERPAVRAELDDWIDRYGDRGIGEMKLETISLRQDPSFLVRALRNLIVQPRLDPAAIERQEQRRREELERRAAATLGRWGRRRLRRAAGGVRHGVAARERTRLVHARLVGKVREIYGAAGLRLHSAGRLDDPSDVFYLTSEELTAFLEGTSVTADLAGLARLRREEHLVYGKETLPRRFETVGVPSHGERLARLDGRAPAGGRRT